jgi:preprotein translocase subunit SecE
MSTTPQGPKTPTSIPTPNLKRGPKRYFSEVKREMKKVVWPTPKETTRLTGIVISLCVILVVVMTLLSDGTGMVMDMISKR